MTLALLLISIAISGCSLQRDENSDYTNRLENVLNVSLEIKQPATPKFPSPRELQQVTLSNTISIREFLSLRKCKLHTVLAHRNSLLGKLAERSQLLFNDLNILATGPTCLAQIEDAQLAEKLKRFLSEKEENIGISLSRAILGEAENRSFWSARQANKNYPKELRQETVGTINNLNSFVESVLKGEYVFQPEDFEQVERDLGRLRFGDGGTLLHYYVNHSHTLQHANALIKERIKQPLCLSGSPTPSARHFQNVVSGIFIKVLQKNAVRLNQREAQLMPSYRRLESQLLAHSPIAYQRWAGARDALFVNGRIAAKTHVGFIQQLFEQCGLTVGPSMR